MTEQKSEYMVEMKHVSKYFAKVIANEDVSFSVKMGEVHALLGENGAGKSTLMNMLYGLYSRDSGEIYWKGKNVDINSTSEAIRLGIGMIHQHFQLVEKFTVLENVILGLKEGKFIEIPRAKIRNKIMKISDTYGLNIKPDELVENLSVGEQQRVEIVKALYRNSDLLIMDEPTAVLTPQEVKKLFEVMKKLKKEGKSVIFISHKLPEVLEICDRISVMRDGRMIQTFVKSKELDQRKLATLMVGREVNLDIKKEEVHAGEVVLDIKGACTNSQNNSCGIHNLSLQVHRGEIVGLAGVDGNGQEDLSELIMGLRKLSKGSITFLGKDVGNIGTREMRKLSFGYIPADRLHAAMVGNLSIAMNMVLNKPDRDPFGTKWRINQNTISKYTREKMEEFNIIAAGDEEKASNLSGGNQQKVVLAREVGEPVDLIIAVYPTRGLDIDASHFVFDIMLKARARGSAVLYISTELEEILQLSDRIGVLYEGRINGILSGKNADVTTIGMLMAGKSA